MNSSMQVVYLKTQINVVQFFSYEAGLKPLG